MRINNWCPAGYRLAVRCLSIAACLLLLMPGVLNGQNWDISLGIGGMNYQGELRSERITMRGVRPGVSAGLGRWMGQRTIVSAVISSGMLTGRDADNPSYLTRRRNLDFKSHIHEFYINGQQFLTPDPDVWFLPFVNVGLGLFWINPYTKDLLGVKHPLYPMSLEGQGLPQYPKLKTPHRLNLSIPVGAGFAIRLSEGLRLELEMLTRKTFTDQIDAVSGRYPSEESLRAARGQSAVDLAYRSDELVGEDPMYPPEGTLRGNPDTMDWYYGFMFRLVWNSWESANSYPPKRRIFKPRGWPYRL